MSSEVDWLLKGTPRPVQMEALLRSYKGIRRYDSIDDAPDDRPLPHAGKPAVGWADFLEMRLGKTPKALNEFMLFKRDWGVSKLLVVSPNSFKTTWKLEAEAYGVDVDGIHVYDSDRKSEYETFLRQHQYPSKSAILVAHYQAFLQSRFVEVLMKWFVNGKTMVVLDESVLVKNREASTTKALLKVCVAAGVVRPMTGMPNPQGVQDLYSQLRIARSLEGVNFFAFRNKYAILGGFKGKQIVGVKNEHDLKRLLDSTAFVARRKDWTKDVEPDVQRIKIPMTPEQKARYKTMEEDFVAYLDSGEVVSVEQAANRWTKLQQISSGFVYDAFGEAHWFMPFEKTPKFQDLLERMDYTGSKMIVFAHFSATVEALYEALSKRAKRLGQAAPAMICRQDTMRKLGLNVDEEKARFNGDRFCRTFVAQGRSAKYGHTLIGTRDDPCDTMAFFENSFSLDDRIQDEQRNQGVWPIQNLILDFYSSEAERRAVTALSRKEHIAGVILGYYRPTKVYREETFEDAAVEDALLGGW